MNPQFRDRQIIDRPTMTGMRGEDRQPDSMFSYVSPEQRVPQGHPLWTTRRLVDDVLRDMSRELSGRWDNLSMWLWYGGKYAGYCLEFKREPHCRHAREVLYTDRYEMDVIDAGHPTCEWFFLKSPDWSSEDVEPVISLQRDMQPPDVWNLKIKVLKDAVDVVNDAVVVNGNRLESVR